MPKTTIQNRHGQDLVATLRLIDNAKGIGFVMHGLGGYKDQQQIQMFAQTLNDSGYSAVLFDTTNTFGESAGKYEDATVTGYYSDLEDVIAWSSSQDWYIEPFVLIGHSLGGISTSLFAQKYPEKVKALAPISTVVSGKLSLETPSHVRDSAEWKRTGWKVTKSVSKPGLIKRLPWSHMEDRLKYDLLPKAQNLAMPVFLAAGDKDDVTPLAHQKILFDALPGQKELHEIHGAGHTFREQAHLENLRYKLTDWLKSL